MSVVLESVVVIVKGAFALQIRRSRFLINAKPWAPKGHQTVMKIYLSPSWRIASHACCIDSLRLRRIEKSQGLMAKSFT